MPQLSRKPYKGPLKTINGKPIKQKIAIPDTDSDSDVELESPPRSSNDESTAASQKADIKHTDFSKGNTARRANNLKDRKEDEDEEKRPKSVVKEIKGKKRADAIARKQEEDAKKRRLPDLEPLRTAESKKLNAPPKNKPKRLREETDAAVVDDGIGDQHELLWQKEKKKKKSRPSYGKGSQNSVGSSQKSSTETAGPSFKNPNVDLQSSPVERPTFKLNRDFDSSPIKSATFVAKNISSAEPTPKKKKFERPREIRASSQDTTSSLSSAKSMSSSDQAPPATQMPVFRTIDIGISMDESFDGPIRGSSSPEPQDEDSLDIFIAGPSDKAICPMCKESVSRVFLESHDNGRMNIRDQTAFCKAHRKLSATEDWKSRGYPDIDWTDLDNRTKSHKRFLLTLLSESSSYYKDVLSDTVRSGQSRTLKQDLNSGFGTHVSAGYFGPRGQRLFSEYIMHEFAPQLRKRAVDDPLVSARGVTGFVQAVMVPELVCKLIEEDLDVDEEDARDVIEDSWELGELLCEEVDDVVERGEEENERRGSVEYIDD